MTKYRESKQFQSLRDQLRAAGCSLRTIDQQVDGQRSFEQVIIQRPGKAQVYGVVIDDTENGYAFYLASMENDIASDVKAVLAAD